jgi:hypothetical protein
VTPRSNIRALLAVGAIVTFSHATSADAQIVIKAGDDVNLKLGLLGQFQADVIHDPETADTTSNLFVRRFRFMFAGQVAKNVTFFADTDVPNLGKTVNGARPASPP